MRPSGRGSTGLSQCSRCDVLLGLKGLHVTDAHCDQDTGALTVSVESPAGDIDQPSDSFELLDSLIE